MLSTAVAGVIQRCMSAKVYSVTMFLNHRETIRVTRRLKKQTGNEFVVTIGRPNYAARDQIRRCKRDHVAVAGFVTERQAFPRKRQRRR